MRSWQASAIVIAFNTSFKDQVVVAITVSTPICMVFQNK